MDRKSIVSGVAVMAIGAVALYQISGLNFGNPARMGPGFFPAMLSGTLIILGAGIIISALRTSRVYTGSEEAEGGTSPRIAIPKLLIVLCSIASFALMIGRFGLVPSLAVAIGISTFASRNRDLKRTAILIFAVPLVSLVIFRYGLGLSIPAFAWKP